MLESAPVLCVHSGQVHALQAAPEAPHTPSARQLLCPEVCIAGGGLGVDSKEAPGHRLDDLATAPPRWFTGSPVTRCGVWFTWSPVTRYGIWFTGSPVTRCGVWFTWSPVTRYGIWFTGSPGHTLWSTAFIKLQQMRKVTPKVRSARGTLSEGSE